jgi:UDP-N-acetylglucosamine 2-epimerase (non-hydrolysing)
VTPLITHVVGARPNFMKAAPVLSAFRARGWPQMLIHTGQHYDELMSNILFRQLEIPAPDLNLGVGSGTHAQQTAGIMTGLETAFLQRRPSLLVVYGDVNSTMAAAITAGKMEVPIAHVEAGLRSFDRSMPEEINRVVTDRLADYLFTHSPDADENLRAEGVEATNIFQVGNVMIDTLIRCLPLASGDELLRRLGISESQPFILVTLHRPSTVDDPALLNATLEVLATLAKTHPVIFPMHPRTKARIAGQWQNTPGLHITEPTGYLEFLGLEKRARLVITDSGGVQEETTYLRVPCLTVRDNTERPITVTAGTNTLIGRDPSRLLLVANERLSQTTTGGTVPALWDGKAAERIAAALATEFR